LEGRYPYLFVDAKIEKVRDGGRVQRKAVVVAHAVHETGRREIIGLDIGAAETEVFWTEFLRSLVARGLVGVQHRPCSADRREGGRGLALTRVLGLETESLRRLLDRVVGIPAVPDPLHRARHRGQRVGDADHRLVVIHSRWSIPGATGAIE
jgi:hypothetical protein